MPGLTPHLRSSECHCQASRAAPNSRRSHRHQNAPLKAENPKSQTQNRAQQRPCIAFHLLHPTREGWSRQQRITAQQIKHFFAHLQIKVLPSPGPFGTTQG